MEDEKLYTQREFDLGCEIYNGLKLFKEKYSLNGWSSIGGDKAREFIEKAHVSGLYGKSDLIRRLVDNVEKKVVS